MSVSRHRHAFTLIELLVVLSIIGLLVALTVPAVQSMRESARRMECSTRLAQLGLALHNFEETHHHFPAADLAYNAPGGFGEHSAFTYLLPYVDQSALYNRINFQLGAFTVERQPYGIADQPIPVYVCPSDQGNLGCNYRFCTGATAYDYDHGSIAGGADGAFVLANVRKAGDFLDGMSNTACMSEKLKSVELFSAWQPQRHFWYSGLATLLGYYPDTEVVINTCASLTVTPAQYEYGWHAGNTWLVGGYDFTCYNHCLPPNSPISDCALNGVGIPVPGRVVGGGVFTARSQHSGGVNCLMMDGSCRFVSNSIDLGVWRSLATRAGDESVGEY